MKRCTIIANKGAGSFSQTKLDAVCRRLSASGREVELVACGDFSEMTATSAKLAKSADAPLIIAAGGDGTINAVFSGLAGSNASCAILPLGTANVLAIELGMQSAETAVERIIAGSFRPITAGVVCNQHKSSRFFLMTGIGFDGRVVRGVTQNLKKRFGKGAYLLSALRCLTSWESGELTVTTGERSFTCHSMIICNAANYGGAFRLAPEASIFSPTLELIAVTDCSRRGPVALAAKALLKHSGRSIEQLSASRVQISGIKPLQADGDDWGNSPVEIFAESNFANIIV